MKNLRTYGKSPFSVAVLHGGPGVIGEMALVAEELSAKRGVLEPFEMGFTVEEQVEELRLLLEEEALNPTTLIGYSWGAWLGFLLAASYPELVKKLILVGSGPFDYKYAKLVQENRLRRLRGDEKKEAKFLLAKLADPETDEGQKVMFARLGEIFAQTDVYDPIPVMPEEVEFRSDIFQSVWPEAAQLRKKGKLLEAAKFIRCPVVAIHGDRDPHPAEGVERPLSKVLKDFRFILLDKCGHTPWIEKQAREDFFRVLNEEIG
jgi:pimeloyl-ACP methyl ester carboxylesterase